MSRLAQAFHGIIDNRDATVLLNLVEESLLLQTNIFRNRIGYVDDIMKNKLCCKGEERQRYNMNIWTKKDDFDILNNISEHFTLVKLMNYPVNVNHALSAVSYLVFYFNYKKALCITRESLDLIVSSSLGEEKVVKFETVFYDVT